MASQIIGDRHSPVILQQLKFAERLTAVFNRRVGECVGKRVEAPAEGAVPPTAFPNSSADIDPYLQEWPF